MKTAWNSLGQPVRISRLQFIAFGAWCLFGWQVIDLFFRYHRPIAAILAVAIIALSISLIVSAVRHWNRQQP
jgi:hypothetical protein